MTGLNELSRGELKTMLADRWEELDAVQATATSEWYHEGEKLSDIDRLTSEIAAIRMAL